MLKNREALFVCNMCHLCLFAYYIVCIVHKLRQHLFCYLWHPPFPMLAIFLYLSVVTFSSMFDPSFLKSAGVLYGRPLVPLQLAAALGVIHIWCHQIFLTYIPHSSSMSTLLLLCHKFPSIFDPSLSKMAISFMESPLHE